MRAVVVYESMFGNTHTVATHIADGLRPRYDTVVVPVDEATDELVAAADLLVIGGPTHVHGLSTEKSRQSALGVPSKDDTVTLDPDAEGPGLRDWFQSIGDSRRGPAAAFDTRIDGPAVFTGRASKGIARRLRHLGFHLVVDPESFLVDKHNHLIEGEAARATDWGASVAAAVAGTTPAR